MPGSCGKTRTKQCTSAGTEVQVIVDMPAERGGDPPSRLMGKGIVVRTESTPSRKAGFAAEVLFQPGFAHLLLDPNDLSSDNEESQMPLKVYHDDRTNGKDEEIPDLSEILPSIAARDQPAPSRGTNLKAARYFAAAALLMLMFGGKISSKSDGWNHRTSLNMQHAPYSANVSTW